MQNTFYLNSENSSELTERIFSIINNAKEYIKTGNFFFKDSKLNNALINASNRGVAIFVLSNLTGCEDRGILNVDLKKENDPHLPNLHDLHALGIHVRCNTDLHAKFLLCDGTQGLIMSANYTSNSLYGNPENGLDITGNELVDMECLFDILYLHPDVILSEDGGKYRYLKERNPISNKDIERIGSNNLLRITACGDDNILTNLRGCRVHSIYDSIISIIKNANEKLYIVSWSYTALRVLKEFHEELKNAIIRNVHVTILYSNEARESNVKKTEEQISKLCDDIGNKNNPKVRQFPRNHSKCVISEKEGIMFTANIDGNRGLLKGFELGCNLSENQRLSAMSKILKTLNNEH